jgi:hypothetical protein
MITVVTNKIEDLIKFIDKSVHDAERNISKINIEILTKYLRGQSSVRLRHLLNNLCSLEGTGYLELGCNRGVSASCALYKNVAKAYLVDHFKQNYFQPNNFKEEGWAEVKNGLAENLKRSGNTEKVTIIPLSVESMSVNQIKHLINVCYYDIDTDNLAYEHVKKIYPKLGKVFILLTSQVRRGADVGIEKVFAEYKTVIHHTVELKSKHAEDAQSWWNGVKIWLCEKE